MSDPGPFGEDDPFRGLPLFADLARLLRSQGPLSWDAARQFAAAIATGGTPETNVDPVERIGLEELGRVAELRVEAVTGLPTSVTGRPVRVVAVTRVEWARRTLDAYRPWLERLSASLSAARPADEGAGGDDAGDLLSGLLNLMGPMMLGMQAGSMVGHLAGRALGQYDLPLPRPASDEVMVVPANVNAFAAEWSLPDDDLRLWLCLSQLAHHAVLGRPHVRSTLDRLVTDYVGGFAVDPGALEARLSEVDPTDPNSLRRALGDPDAMLGTMQTPAQRQLLPRLEGLLAVVEGYVDQVMEEAGGGLVAAHRLLVEALHRHRVEVGPADRFVEHLLGVELGRRQYERGAAFVHGVRERGGDDALARLWASERTLPTPAEVDAPGLWLARLELHPDEH